MKIENGKTYIDGRGRRVRIVATDRLTAATDRFSVVGLLDCGAYEDCRTFTREGQYSHSPSEYDLVREVGQYDHIKRGDVVLAGIAQIPAHFHSVAEDGTPCVYPEGLSPWTAGSNPATLRVSHVELVETLNRNSD